MLNPEIGVYYEWQSGRGEKYLRLFIDDNIEDFSGILQHDAYKPYLTLAKEEELEHTACMAHIRRYFEKALAERPALVSWFMRKFAQLYETEKNLREEKATAEQRARRRKISSRPLLEVLKKASLHLSQKSSILPQSLLGKALQYALGQLPNMDTWIENGQVEIDNNLVENSIRPTKLGLKNWLFFGSERAGEDNAILYTLVENVRRLNRDPYAYLNWLFEQLIKTPNPSNLDELLPTSWASKHPESKNLRPQNELSKVAW